MAMDWQMPRHAEGCGACGAAFPPGSEIRAWLVEQGDAFARIDCCPSCPQPDFAPLASWRTRRPAERANRRPTFDAPGILELFGSLAESTADDAPRLRFVLALLLWRRKVLRMTGTHDNAHGERWNFETSDGTKHAVLRPELDEAQIEQLSAQLEQMLAGAPQTV